MKKYFVVLTFLVGIAASAQVVRKNEPDPEELVVDAELARFTTADGQDIGRFIGTSFNYPSKALLNGISGIIIVEFIVEKDGGVKEIKVVQSVCDECDAEAVRVIRKLILKPIEIEGKPERVRFRVPIRMILQD